MTVEELLQKTEPYELFTNDVHKNKSIRKQLLLEFHPDSHGGEVEYREAVVRINALYEQAEEQLKEGIWIQPGQVILNDTSGKTQVMQYRRKDAFELGTRFVGRRSVLFLLEEEHKEFAGRMTDSLRKIGFADDSMAIEFTKYLPKIQAMFQTMGGRIGIVVEKPQGLYTAAELLQYYDGAMDPRSVTWILSSLYNLLCFFEFNQINHNGITIQNYYISPQYHYGKLLGGWWYATGEGEKLYCLSEEMYERLSPIEQQEGRSSCQIDLEAVHAIGRTLLGEETGIPEPLKNWLMGPAMETAYEEYSKWNQVIQDSFGGRFFFEMGINEEKLEQRLGGR